MFSARESASVGFVALGALFVDGPVTAVAACLVGEACLSAASGSAHAVHPFEGLPFGLADKYHPYGLVREGRPSDLAREGHPSDLAREGHPSDLAREAH